MPRLRSAETRESRGEALDAFVAGDQGGAEGIGDGPPRRSDSNRTRGSEESRGVGEVRVLGPDSESPSKLV